MIFKGKDVDFLPGCFKWSIMLRSNKMASM